MLVFVCLGGTLANPLQILSVSPCASFFFITTSSYQGLLLLNLFKLLLICFENGVLDLISLFLSILFLHCLHACNLNLSSHSLVLCFQIVDPALNKSFLFPLAEDFFAGVSDGRLATFADQVLET